MKPVAWMQTFEDGEDKRMSLDFERIGINDIPLYTAPRELSDEEIKAIANNLTCTPDKNWNVLFAKAILKKASEK